MTTEPDASRADGPPSSTALDERIHALFPKLTPKQQRLARLLLEEKLLVALCSVDELGRHAEVDAATVVRFSQRLGYDGFADLRQAVRAGIPLLLTALEKVKRTLADRDDAKDVVASVYADDIGNLEATARLNEPATIDAAVQAILDADKVYVIGFGVVAPVGDLLVHQLNLVGSRAHRAPASMVDAAIDIASATPDDVVISLDVWRYLKAPLELTAAARAAGAATVAISDSAVCSLARASEVSLVCATTTAELSHSVTAFATLANILATQVALARPERTIQTLARIDDLYVRLGGLTD